MHPWRLGLVLLGWACASAALGQVERDHFIHLHGEAAAGYRLPADVMPVGTRTQTPRGLEVQRYQQYLGDARVLGGQLTLYRSGDTLVAVIGAHAPEIAPTNRVGLGESEVLRLIRDRQGDQGVWSAELMIDPASGRFFYAVENRRFDSRWLHWVDAATGQILARFDRLTHGSGLGVKGDIKDLTGLTRFTGSHFELRSPDGLFETYDARNRIRFPAIASLFAHRLLPGVMPTDSDDVWDLAGTRSPGHAALVDAHYYAWVTYDYYLGIHGRDGIDDARMPIVSTAHFSRDFCNAFWNGEQMVYGDGDGPDCLPLSGALEIVAHELTHGVTEYTSNLIYRDESGALNVAFSDIMSVAVEFHAADQGLDPLGEPNWRLGEAVIQLSPGLRGIRDMSDPELFGDPDHYSERFTDKEDNGGVHINSGIINHAFYLLVDGGLNASCASPTDHASEHCSGLETPVTGIGMARAEQLFYLAFIGLPADANLCEARRATETLAGAVDPEAQPSVAAAWSAVGVCP